MALPTNVGAVTACSHSSSARAHCLRPGAGRGRVYRAREGGPMRWGPGGGSAGAAALGGRAAWQQGAATLVIASQLYGGEYVPGPGCPANTQGPPSAHCTGRRRAKQAGLQPGSRAAALPRAPRAARTCRDHAAVVAVQQQVGGRDRRPGRLHLENVRGQEGRRGVVAARQKAARGVGARGGGWAPVAPEGRASVAPGRARQQPCGGAWDLAGSARLRGRG
jgi:hypothetical protein